MKKPGRVDPEFNRRTLEVLRQPLEDGTVTISRALHSTTFPADMMLIAALNPCPCGYRGDPRRECHCTVPQIDRYMGKISGPLLDRIDIHIEVPAVPFKELSGSESGTTSGEMRAIARRCADWECAPVDRASAAEIRRAAGSSPRRRASSSGSGGDSP